MLGGNIGAEWAIWISLLKNDTCFVVTSSPVTLQNLRNLENCVFCPASSKLRDWTGHQTLTSFLDSIIIPAQASSQASICESGRKWPKNPLNDKIHFSGIMLDLRYLQKIKVHTHNIDR